MVHIFGAFYNYVLLKTLALYKTLNRYFKVIIPFLLAGVFGLAFPMVLGSGHHIIEALSLSQSIKWLKDLSLPSGSFVIAIRRNGKYITPRGDTRIRAEDTLIVLTSKKDEPAVRELLQKMTGARNSRSFFIT